MDDETIAVSADGRIVINPRVVHGKPVIRGTRVMVSVVVGAVAGGDSVEQVADDYRITREDVLAAIAYAGELVRTEEHYGRARAS
jgi:uncharacterized protein (DUF433 family)